MASLVISVSEGTESIKVYPPHYDKVPLICGPNLLRLAVGNTQIFSKQQGGPTTVTVTAIDEPENGVRMVYLDFPDCIPALEPIIVCKPAKSGG